MGLLTALARGALMLMLLRRVIRHTLADHRLALEAMRRQGGGWVAVRPMAMTHGPHTGRYRVAIEELPPRERGFRDRRRRFHAQAGNWYSVPSNVPAIAY